MFENFTKQEKKILLLIILFTALGLTVMGIRKEGSDALPQQQESITGLNEATRLKSSFKERLERKDEEYDALPEGFKVNINSATKSQLKLLPGIGKVTANRIIEYRKDHNKFNNLADLKKVKGIGTKTFANIKKYLILKATGNKN